MRINLFEKMAYILASVGAINLGLAELLNFNFFSWFLNLVRWSDYSTYFYLAVGLAGMYAIYDTLSD